MGLPARDRAGSTPTLDGNFMKRPEARNRPFRGAKPARMAPGPRRDEFRPRNIYRRPESATSRQETLCGIKAVCGACKYVNLDYQASLTEKHKAGLALLEQAGVLVGAKILPPVPSPRPFGYRSLFKLAVRPSRAKAKTPEDVAPRFDIGLFAQGSHDVVNMDECPLHAEALKNLIRDLRLELEQSTLTPFDEKTHTGQVRYLAARAAHLTGELMLTFVVTEPVKTELRRIVDALRRRGHKVNSAHMNINAEKGNAIFTAESTRLAGTDRLRERVLDLDFEIGPTAFFQINPWQAINLYRRVEQIAGPATGDKIVAWDLYCGLGQISLVLARLGYKVMGIEENPEAVVGAQENAKKNKLSERAEFIAARVEEAQAKVPVWARAPQLIVANPSRRGLAEQTRLEIAGLLKAYPESRFIYVSCEAETLARDLAEIKAATGFHVRQLEGFDMFAQTADMEWLAVLTR